jgi:hypothetical protein
MKLTLQGGPFNGKEVDIPPGCVFVHIPVIFPIYPDRYRPWVDGFIWEPWNGVHVYSAITGIHLRGRMPANRMHWPTFDPFPRYSALQARIRAIRHPRRRRTK